jgi:threonine dehydrogenase-like Zn-dependent dehydrogenase
MPQCAVTVDSLASKNLAMKALCWCGTNRVQVEQVPEPKILNPRDAIIRITSTAICGSDLHLLHGVIPTMRPGDILGHEFMGEVMEVGSSVKNLRPGDRVVVPFTIACGNCFYCKRELWSLCDNSNPNAWMAEKLNGYSGSGLFGYSHIYGGYAGGQAEFARVPFADVGPIKVPASLSDEKVLFLSDILPTAYMAAKNCNIHPGDMVAIWGCGPVGLLTIASARLLGAERIIAIDQVPGRLAIARTQGAETINFSEVDTLEALAEMTGGRGPDSCIDAVGLESHGMSAVDIYDRVKMSLYLATDRPNVLRQCLMACRKGGTVSIPFAKGLTLHMGQTHVHTFMKPLLEHIEAGDLDPSFIITHELPLDAAADAYKRFDTDKSEWIKVVLKTGAVSHN